MDRRIKLWLIWGCGLLFLLLIIGFLLGFQLRFALGDELALTVNPRIVMFDILNGQEVDSIIQIKTKSFSQCNPSCFVHFGNKSTKIFMFKGEGIWNYSVSAPTIGHGELWFSSAFSCRNQRTALCPTDEKERSGSNLIKLNYSLSEGQVNSKSRAKFELNNLIRDLNSSIYLEKEIELISQQLSQLNVSIVELHEQNENAQQNLNHGMDFWNQERYNEISVGTAPLQEAIALHVIALERLNHWNEQAEQMRQLQKVNISFALHVLPDIQQVNDSVQNIALMIQGPVMDINLTKDEDIIRSELRKAKSLLGNSTCLTINITDVCKGDYPDILQQFEQQKMHFVAFETPLLKDLIQEISEPLATCCYLDQCELCKSHPPVVFIHGHAFNERNNPEYSMNIFANIQQRLENHGYLNGGQFNAQDDVQYSHIPVSLRASYYLIDHYLGVEVRKSERVENYALRLHEILQLIRERSGTKDVVVVAHSMGGLVAREYVRIFDDENIHLILINTPNHGVTETVRAFCPVFGANKECEDMATDSIFLRRLHTLTNEGILNIYTDGCEMGNTTGDGIVTKESAYLPGAKNIVIDGKCTDNLKTDLHSNVLDSGLYPELLNILVEELQHSQ